MRLKQKQLQLNLLLLYMPRKFTIPRSNCLMLSNETESFNLDMEE